MSLLVLAGIFEEIKDLVKRENLRFSREKNCFENSAGSLFVSTTGPGLPKPGKIKKKIGLIQPDRIVLTGLVGSLISGKWKVGDRVSIGSIVDPAGSRLYVLHSSGSSLVSVSEPVFSSMEKAKLRSLSGADVVDMESVRFFRLMQEISFPQDRLQILKVIGDLPEQEVFFHEEERLRSARSRGIWKTGFFLTDPLTLYRRLHLMGIRKKALRGLTRAQRSFLQQNAFFSRSASISLKTDGGWERVDDNKTRLL